MSDKLFFFNGITYMPELDGISFIRQVLNIEDLKSLKTDEFLVKVVTNRDKTEIFAEGFARGLELGVKELIEESGLKVGYEDGYFLIDKSNNYSKEQEVEILSRINNITLQLGYEYWDQNNNSKPDFMKKNVLHYIKAVSVNSNPIPLDQAIQEVMAQSS